MYISSATAIVAHVVTDHATVRSNASVCLLMTRRADVRDETNCWRYRTRGASASMNTVAVPPSHPHRTLPSPASWRAHRRRHVPHPRPASQSVRMHDRFSPVVVQSLDEDLVDTPTGAKYPGVAHTVLRAVRSDLRQARNIGGNPVLRSDLSHRHPPTRRYGRNAMPSRPHPRISSLRSRPRRGVCPCGRAQNQQNVDQ